MLPAQMRMRRGAEFTETVRRGSRGTSRTVTVHLASAHPGSAVHGADGAGEPCRVGLVVGRDVGPAVVRNRVRRRLRHLLRERFAALPVRSSVVVRANPAAAALGSSVLGRDLDQALERARSRSR